jgi:hypothetical protein
LRFCADLWNVEIKPFKEVIAWTIYYLRQPIKACYINLLNKKRGLQNEYTKWHTISMVWKGSLRP